MSKLSRYQGYYAVPGDVLVPSIPHYIYLALALEARGDFVGAYIACKGYDSLEARAMRQRIAARAQNQDAQNSESALRRRQRSVARRREKQSLIEAAQKLGIAYTKGMSIKVLQNLVHKTFNQDIGE